MNNSHYCNEQEYLKCMLNVAKKYNENFCVCSRCGIYFITSVMHKRKDLCIECFSEDNKDKIIKKEKHKEYMRNYAKEKRLNNKQKEVKNIEQEVSQNNERMPVLS